jgi:hypothetical protein
MSALLKQILGWLCPHRFSWPHSGVDGQDYQVCLFCGTAFEYDVTTMRGEPHCYGINFTYNLTTDRPFIY